MSSTLLLDACGRRRSPATLSSFHQGRPPRNKSQRYPADPTTVEEIIAVMHAAGDQTNDAVRLRGADRRALARRAAHQRGAGPDESDLDLDRGAILIRRGKGGNRREVGMDRWAWEQLTPWLRRGPRFPSAPCSACCAARPAVAPGPLLESARSCTRPPPEPEYDDALRRISSDTPTQCEMSHEGVPLLVIQRQRPCRPRDHLGLPPRDRQH